MAVSSCLFHNHFALKINLPTSVTKHSKYTYPPKVTKTELFGMHIGCMSDSKWSFAGGSGSILMPNSGRFDPHGRRRSFRLHASWLTSARLAGDAFTLGTAAVLPFYTLMIAAPNAELTKKLMRSSIPYLLLGVFYTYLFYVSWRPDTIQLVFFGKHWLPELPSIAKLFSNQMTLASAWVDLLVIDLFAARQVYHDGLENNIETRHSISLCLFICPIGIIVHALTKALTNSFRQSKAVIR